MVDGEEYFHGLSVIAKEPSGRAHAWYIFFCRRIWKGLSTDALWLDLAEVGRASYVLTVAFTIPSALLDTSDAVW